ncbi:ADP-ribosylglycohydrolase family protein [Marinactinospora endophytica]
MVDGRLDDAARTLRGLALGDAFGEGYFLPEEQARRAIADRVLTRAPWRWTDDTEMALSVVEVLAEHGRIDQDALVTAFVHRHDPSRGYGPSVERMLRAVAAGADWRELAGAQFGGEGSHGNGAAMRVAPLGAFFSADLDRAAEEAARSAVVTHTHPEAINGAVAVALAAALAVRGRDAAAPQPREFLTRIAARLDRSTVRGRLEEAARLASDTVPAHAAAVLGDGSALSAQDTVPFALWSAAGHLDDLTEALWATVAGLGDRDTTCAIAAGVVAARSGVRGVPREWLAACEELPSWSTAGEDGVGTA